MGWPLYKRYLTVLVSQFFALFESGRRWRKDSYQRIKVVTLCSCACSFLLKRVTGKVSQALPEMQEDNMKLEASGKFTSKYRPFPDIGKVQWCYAWCARDHEVAWTCPMFLQCWEIRWRQEGKWMGRLFFMALYKCEARHACWLHVKDSWFLMLLLGWTSFPRNYFDKHCIDSGRLQWMLMEIKVKMRVLGGRGAKKKRSRFFFKIQRSSRSYPQVWTWSHAVMGWVWS